MKTVKANFVNARIFVVVMMVVSVMLAAGSAEAKNKRYGIFIGINNYPGTEHDLYGAVNDAENMQELLVTNFKFPRGNTTLLLDDKATRDAIMSQISAYGKLVGPGDELVVQYSGHGSLWPDKFSEVLDETVKTEVTYPGANGGEDYHLPLDYYDSALVPWDADSADSGKNWGGLILDDELYALFAPITKKGATVVFISDSCHSGTVGKGEMNKARIKFMPIEKLMKAAGGSVFTFEKPANQVKAGPVAPNPYYITITAAKDNEFALDDSESDTPGGLFTETLIHTIRSSKTPLTYRRLIALVQPQVANASRNHSNDQHPQIDPRFGNADGRLFEPVIRKS
ncbi:MAG TPA: caspase family protein [Pyrinomonadaceae bacterium]|nr:caspase family protein [Pyrinomonadaceae bacterium]